MSAAAPMAAAAAPGRRLRVGVDVGGTRLKLALVDGEAIVARHVDALTADDRDADALVARIVAGVDQLRAFAGVAASARDALDGIGLGVAGVLSADASRVVESPNLPWLNGVALPARVAAALGARCVADNDAHCVGWGEAVAGAGRGSERLVVLAIGTGLGGAVVLDGRLMRGSRGRGAELGHLVVDRAGPACGCGGVGCLEQYASQTGLFAAMVRAGRCVADVEPAGAVRALLHAARGGDAAAVALVDRAGDALGVVMARMQRLLAVDRFVIAGGIAAALDVLSPALMRAMRAGCDGAPARIDAGTLGVDAGTLGAALLFDQR